MKFQWETERIALYLLEHGIKCFFYHAGLDKEQRKTIEDEFSHSPSSVLCATSAYGLGVDKKNIGKSMNLILIKDIGESFIHKISREDIVNFI